MTDKCKEYTAEIRKYLEDFDDDEFESDIISELKFKIQELALELYVKFARIDCTSLIEPTIVLFHETFSNIKKLHKVFYIMICLLIRQKISWEDFQEILNGEPEKLKNITKFVVNSPETLTFISKDGINALFSIYKSTGISLLQSTKEIEEYTKNSEELSNDITQSCIKEIEACIKQYKKIVDTIESFIYALHYSFPIVEHFLLHPPFDDEFYTNILPTEFGIALTLRLITILSTRLTGFLRTPIKIGRAHF